jgi:hypothetical protein
MAFYNVNLVCNKIYPLLLLKYKLFFVNKVIFVIRKFIVLMANLKFNFQVYVYE